MPGLIGNRMGQAAIDPNKPQINNADGSFSTERTITVEMDGKHYVLPTIVGGKQYTPEQAIELFRRGANQAVGIFASQQEADAAAAARSDAIGRLRQKSAPPAQPATPPQQVLHGVRG
jgi:hypothetical protein